jgi:hypothetical protein
MSEAFIPAAPATPDLRITIPGFGTHSIEELVHHIAQLKEELEGTRRNLEAAYKRDLEREPLVEAIQHIVDQRLDQWVRSEGPLEVLGAIIESSVEDQLSSSIDSHVEAALENATVEVEAYIRP